jgi:hypothetical protein
MTLQHPGERTLKTLIRRNDHDARVLVLLRLGPSRVYAGLLWWAQMKDYDRGWAAHAFRELYGTWPRPRDRGEPARPSIELEEWLSTHPKKRPRVAAATPPEAA